jgi:hypothetical protein
MQNIHSSEYWHLVVRDSRKYQVYSGQRSEVGELLDTVHRDELGNEAVDYARGIEWIPSEPLVTSPRTPDTHTPAPEPIIEYHTVERVVEVPVECCRFCKGWRRFLAGVRNLFRVRV